MRNTLLILFSLSAFHVFGQFDYELFLHYENPKVRQLNANLSSVTELQLKDNHTSVKSSFTKFNSQALPIVLIQYDDNGIEASKKEFIYDANGHLLKIDSYKGGTLFGTAQFELNSSSQIGSYSDYVYSSSDREKLLVWTTSIEYNPNKTIKKSIKIEGSNKDTVEVNYFDTLGIQVKTLQKEGGLRTTKIEYIWNIDKTEMKELHYENDSSVYNTITHRYKDNKEIERIDPSTSPKPFYWKYDNKGRLTETNEGFFYELFFTYDNVGLLAKKTMNVLFSDSDEKDLPKKIYFEYQYDFQK